MHKIGTSTIAVLAHNESVPMYAVCTTQKFLPTTVPHSYQEMRDPADLTKERIRHLTPVNLAFDLTPLEHLAGAVIEKGLLDREELLRVLSTWRVNEALDLESCG